MPTTKIENPRSIRILEGGKLISERRGITEADAAIRGLPAREVMTGVTVEIDT